MLWPGHDSLKLGQLVSKQVRQSVYRACTTIRSVLAEGVNGELLSEDGLGQGPSFTISPYKLMVLISICITCGRRGMLEHPEPPLDMPP